MRYSSYRKAIRIPRLLKCLLLLPGIAAGNAGAQQTSPAADPLYPYLSREGLFGYANEQLQVRIRPQYKRAGLFTAQGYAIVTDAADKMGIIDKNNRVIVPVQKESIRLFPLAGFTLAETGKSYHANYRFWNWKFLPGLNLLGGGSRDHRLFDTKVKRKRKTIWILGQKNRKIVTKTVAAGDYRSQAPDIVPLDSNQVLIDGSLYDVRKNGARLVAARIKDPLDGHRFARQQRGALQIIDRRGKAVSKQEYTLLDSLEFNAEDVPVFIRLQKDSYEKLATAYTDQNGQTFLYPDFTKSLPRSIHNDPDTGSLTTGEVLHSTLLMAPVPRSDYFIFIGYDNGQRFFRFLDTGGQWHQALPPGIPFTVTLPSGDILWPEKDHYIPPDQVPDKWEVQAISQPGESPLYNITIQQDKTMRQGIWDLNKRQWLVAPDYYQVYPLGENEQQWRFQRDKDGLWGILGSNGQMLVKPRYYSISPDGWVQLPESGKYISFYLHLPALQEFREK